MSARYPDCHQYWPAHRDEVHEAATKQEEEKMTPEQEREWNEVRDSCDRRDSVKTFCVPVPRETFLAADAELRALRAEVERLMGAIDEILTVADLRGDADLPHPADDPKMWTARMTDAWTALREIVAEKEAKG